MRNAAPARAAFGASADPVRRLYSPAPPVPQAPPPLERYEPYLPHDKLVLFALAPVHRLVGTWQGPGTIAELRQAEGWRP